MPPCDIANRRLSCAMHHSDFLVKTVLIGDTGVGKTSLLKRFTSMQFPENHVTTTAVEFAICTLNLKGKNITLQFWDTAGQERFRSITTS